MSDSEPSIGIDLGTTNSAVATATDGLMRIIERASGQRLIPSMVGIRPDGTRVVGEEARQLAETFPENVAYATKRFMGQRWTPELAAKARTTWPFAIAAGPNDDIRIKIAGQTMPVTQIAAMVLSELRSDAQAHFGREVRQAVITVPAAFTDAQRQATKEAAAIAGLEVARLINEPTAAAIAYGLAESFKGTVVVFDLGGGTFDVSVLDIRDGVFSVVATGGDPFFGGEDFDGVLVQWLLSHLTDGPTRERVMHDKAALQRLKGLAEQAKKAISTVERSRISAVLVPDAKGRGVVLESMLTRDFFERLVRPKTEHCLAIVEKVLTDAKLDAEHVDAVLLVGGMTRVPLLRQLVSERFKKVPSAAVNPDEAVALGAAVHAAELVSQRKSTLLLDVVGSTLSVGILGGGVKPLIAKNSSLPCTAKELFNPGRAGQTTARVSVLQGESARADENTLLGELTLTGLSGQFRADSELEVTFELGTDGLLSVSVVDRQTGHKEAARLVARTDLSPQELERLKQKEAEHQAAAPIVPLDDREKQRLVRRALHQLIVSLRGVHKDIRAAALDTGDRDARDVTEALARQIVDAERVEASGSLDEVLATTTSLRDLLSRLTDAPLGQ